MPCVAGYSAVVRGLGPGAKAASARRNSSTVRWPEFSPGLLLSPPLITLITSLGDPSTLPPSVQWCWSPVRFAFSHDRFSVPASTRAHW
jgi:hypothetical protein